MRAEEVLKYENDKFFKTIRRWCFATIWLVIFCFLAVAFIEIFYFKKCHPKVVGMKPRMMWPVNRL